MENSSRQNFIDTIVDEKMYENNTLIDRKNLYQRYTNYIDSSKCTINHYNQKKFFSGQEKYIHKINSWIQDDQNLNKPLVFKTQSGCGIKTILVNWQKNIILNTYKKQKILSIIHFASNGSNNRNYFYSLYRIIIKLRQQLKLKQNVDLLQQNIRKFFSYWLDLCSSQVQKQLIIYCSQNIYNKIVIIIEGVDQFIDHQTGKQANIAFWLPQIFPKNIKVIVTASKGSQSLQHLQKSKCQIIDVKFNFDISFVLLKTAKQQETILDQQIQKKFKNTLEKIATQNNSYTMIEFFRGSFLIKKSFQKYSENCNEIKKILKEKIDFKNLSKVSTVQELYNFVIDFWVENSPLKTKLESILIYLSLTQKGLTSHQIISLTKINQVQWNFFLIIFNSLIIKYEGIFAIKSSSFVETVFERDRMKKGQTNYYQQTLIDYHEKLAISLQNTFNCIRKLEEQSYHLFAAKSYFKLKEIISNIENFLLMFNPHNKYQLSKYWQKLEQKGFDPVIQYNKAVQGFSMHYHPSDENIFRIIVQISRFLKEFCDFETCQTPNFRHPYIEGNAVQLHKIGLLKQLSDLDIFYDNSFNNNEDFDLNQQLLVEDQIRQLRQKYFPKQSHIIQEVVIKIQKSENYTNSINEMMKDLQELNKKKIKKKNLSNVKILSDIQQLNVDVPMNRQKFRNFYLKHLQEFIKKDQGYCQNININHNDNIYLDIDDNSQNINLNQEKVQQSFNKIRQNYRMRHIKPSLYYYKRWIWIQFPWVCISLNNNYSTTPQLCKKIEGDDFDTLQQESKYTKQALLVAIEARQKKRQMFTKKDDLIDSKSFSKSKRNMFNINKFPGSRFGETFSSKNKNLSVKSSNILDLSLNGLTKQLQMRKKKLKIQDKVSYEQSQIFLSQINENCQEDMKFISLRRLFKPPTMQGMEPNEVLPKLKWVIKQHTNYELNYIKTNIQQKKKKLNKIIYQNKKLAEAYQELKIKQNNQKKNLNQHESEKNIKKNKILQDLIKKKEEIINEFCKSLLQKQRLKIILKLCSQNKTKNQEYLASLNYLLQNFKKMINFEKQNMKAITEELQEIKILNEKQNLMQNQKQKNKQIVEREALNYLEEKSKLEKQIENITLIISQDIKEQKDRFQNSLSGHMKNKQQKTMMMMQEKKTKLLEEKLQKLQQEYDSLQTLFDFEGFDFENAPKFKKLMEQNQRNKKLKIAYFERKNKLEQITSQYQKINQQNEKQAQDEIKKMTLKKQVKCLNQQNKCNNKNDGKCNETRSNIILDNISLKLGVKDKKEIVNVLKSKLEYLKKHNMQKYCQLIEYNKSRTDLHLMKS